jgi:hypothetical protein
MTSTNNYSCIFYRLYLSQSSIFSLYEMSAYETLFGIKYLIIIVNYEMDKNSCQYLTFCGMRLPTWSQLANKGFFLCGISAARRSCQNGLKIHHSLLLTRRYHLCLSPKNRSCSILILTVFQSVCKTLPL